MGNQQSTSAAHRKLAHELPPAHKMGHDDNWNYTDIGMKVFTSDQDRDQFIHAVMVVATSNGTLDLSQADFKVFYSRKPSSPDKLFASIVAMQEGKIVAKIEGNDGGAEQRDALLALRRDVEVQLDGILAEVPSSSVSGSGPRGAVGGSVPADLPPAYTGKGIAVGREKH